MLPLEQLLLAVLHWHHGMPDVDELGYLAVADRLEELGRDDEARAVRQVAHAGLPPLPARRGQLSETLHFGVGQAGDGPDTYSRFFSVSLIRSRVGGGWLRLVYDDGADDEYSEDPPPVAPRPWPQDFNDRHAPALFRFAKWWGVLFLLGYRTPFAMIATPGEPPAAG